MSFYSQIRIHLLSNKLKYKIIYTVLNNIIPDNFQVVKQSYIDLLFVWEMLKYFLFMVICALLRSPNVLQWTSENQA